MLRLWPDTLTAGLFPGQCWLAVNRGVESRQLAPTAETQDWLNALDSLLDEQAGAIARFSRLDVQISDSLSHIAHAPWQDELHSQAELQAYARACLARHGMDAGEGWAVQLAFRRFGGAGLAVALRTDLLQEVEAIAARHKLRLRSVLPASGVAYWRCRAPHHGGSAALLFEADRITAHLYEHGKFLGIDVQPLISDLDRDGDRLLRRIAALVPQIEEVIYWRFPFGVKAERPEFVNKHFPAVRLNSVNLQWSMR